MWTSRAVSTSPSSPLTATTLPEEQLEAAQLVIENRLVALNVTDYELYVDNNSDSLILEFFRGSPVRQILTRKRRSMRSAPPPI